MDLKLAKKGFHEDEFIINNIYSAFINDQLSNINISKINLYDDNLIDYGEEIFLKIFKNAFSGDFSKNLYEYTINTKDKEINNLLTLYYNKLHSENETIEYIKRIIKNLNYSGTKMGYLLFAHCSTSIRVEKDYIPYDFIICTTHKVKEVEPNLYLAFDKKTKINKNENLIVNKSIDSCFVYPSLNDESKDVNHLFYKASNNNYNENLLKNLFNIENKSKNKDQKENFTSKIQEIPNISYRQYININESIGEKLIEEKEESSINPEISLKDLEITLNNEGIKKENINSFIIDLRSELPDENLSVEAIYNKTINIKKDKLININIENMNETITLSEDKLIVNLDSSFIINNSTLKLKTEEV